MDETAPQAARLVLAAEFGTVTADMLRATFDHWRIFQSHGKWWAVRPGDVAGQGPKSLIHPVVGAYTLEGLGDQSTGG